MDSLPQDTFATILAKLPLKRIATSKLVCKQWKSFLESKYFYQHFQSHHHDSHSLWSLMCSKSRKEVMAHYGCTNWNLTRSLGSYISSFITALIRTERLYRRDVRVAAYSDVGLILISLENPEALNGTYFVANPISREYGKIRPPLPCSYPTRFVPLGLVAQVENNVVLSYKVVLMNAINIERLDKDISLLIYSSETCLWSFNTIRSPLCFRSYDPISLNGNFYWIGYDDTLQKHLRKFALVYHNFFASTGTESDRCIVIHFPGVEKNDVFRKVCTTSQGSLMYMKIVSGDKDDGSVEHKLSVWKLKSEEWQLVSQVSPDFMNPGLDHIQVTINPFDAKTVYFWSKVQNRMASINFDECRIGLHNNFECSSDGCNQRIYEGWNFWEGLLDTSLRMVVLPRWLYRIPCSPSRAT